MKTIFTNWHDIHYNMHWNHVGHSFYPSTSYVQMAAFCPIVYKNDTWLKHKINPSKHNICNQLMLFVWRKWETVIIYDNEDPCNSEFRIATIEMFQNLLNFPTKFWIKLSQKTFFYIESIAFCIVGPGFDLSSYKVVFGVYVLHLHLQNCIFQIFQIFCTLRDNRFCDI